jgi:hypothetical protein
VFTIVFAVIVRAERQAEAGGEGQHRPATLGPAASGRIDPKPSSG